MKTKQFVVGLMLSVAAMSMLAEAIAKPMGGGRSFGRQSNNVARQAPAPAPAAQRQATPAPAATPTPAVQPKPSSPWKGILGGALLGLGLGALLSHFGLGGAMASMIGSLLMVALLALAVFFIYRLIRGKRADSGSGAGNPPFQGFGGNQPQPAAAGYGNATPEIGSRLQPQAFEAAPAASGVGLNKPAPAAPWGVPADFDTAAFLRHAKTNFIRLQASWDRSDINDIREFTTPEVFAELKMQIQERNGVPDYTDVVTIDAELMGIETSATDYLASVKFSGSVRAAPNAPAEPLNEVWNLVKPLQGDGGWMLAGIQQVA